MNYELGVSHTLVIKSSPQCNEKSGWIPNSYPKVPVANRKTILKKTTFVSFLKTKKSKKAYSQNDSHLPVYNSVESVHLGLSHSA